jgi:hypothetical protein
MMPALRSGGAARLRFRRRAGCTFVFKFGLHNDHITPVTPAARPLADAFSLENLGSGPHYRILDITARRMLLMRVE